MTQNDIDNGRLIYGIDIAVTRPAEFVILRIIHHTIRTGLDFFGNADGLASRVHPREYR